MKRITIVLAPVALTVLLAACGGSDDTPDPLAEVPATASESSAGMVNYLNSLPALSAEGYEPVSLDSYTPTTSETADPEPVS